MSIFSINISKSRLQFSTAVRFLTSSNFKLHYLPNRHFKSTPLRHHYEILNIETNTNINDIKKSYKTLIKKWHPDMHSSKSFTKQKEAQKRFLLIREAYEIIINHKQNSNNTTHQSYHNQAFGEQHQYGFTAGRRGTQWSKQAYNHYQWDRKIYDKWGTEINDNERVYEKYYPSNGIGKIFENLYDSIRYMYLTHPYWIQWFLIATCTICFGVSQYMRIKMNDKSVEVSAVSNSVSKSKRSTAGISTSANLLALQPHVNGHKLWEPERESVQKKKSVMDRDGIKVTVIDRNGKKSKKIVNRNDLNKNRRRRDGKNGRKGENGKKRNNVDVLKR